MTRWIGRLGAALGLILVFAVAIVAGVVLHLDVPASRRLAAREANRVLGSFDWGRIVVGAVERLTLSNVVARSVDLDLTGTGRIHAEYVRVRIDPLRALREAFRERDVIAVYIRSVDVGLLDAAFTPGPMPTETKPGASTTKRVKLDIGDADVTHAYGHGPLRNGFFVDVDLDGLRSSITIDRNVLHTKVSTRATARAIVREPIQIELEGGASIPLGGGAKNERSGILDAVASAGGVHLDLHGAMTGDRVMIDAVVPETAPESVRSLWESAPVASPVSLRARVEGTLPRPDARVELALGAASAQVRAELDLEGGPSADFSGSVRDLDLRALGIRWATSRLGFDAKGHLRVITAAKPEIPVEGWASISTVPGVLAGQTVPRIEGRIELARALRAWATVDEPGALGRVELTRAPTGRLQGSLEANIAALAEVPRLTRQGVVATGGAVLHAQASLDEDVVQAQGTLDVHNLSTSNLKVGEGRVEAQVEGPLETPRLAASAYLANLKVKGYAVNDAAVHANGTLEAFDVAVAGRGGIVDDIRLEARVERKTMTAVSALSARLERGGELVVVRANRLAIGSGTAAIDGLTVDGLGGRIEANASRFRGGMTANVSAPDFDLDRLAFFLGLPPQRLGGKGTLKISLDARKDRAAADGHLSLVGAKLGLWPKFDATVDVGLDGSSVQGLLSVRNSEIGGVHVDLTGALGGPVLEMRSLRGATGRVNLSTDRISLTRLCARSRCPRILDQAAAASRAMVEAHAVVARQSVGGNDTSVHLDFQAADLEGPLAHFALDSQMDLDQTLATHRLPTDAPIEADFGIEPRSLDELPANARIPGLSGNAEVHGYAEGTIGKPFVVLEVAGHSLKYEAGGQGASSVDVEWVTTYDLEQAASDITLRSGGRDVAKASIQANASLEKLLAGGDRAWNGGAYAVLDGFPLDFFPTSPDARYSGSLSGKIAASGIHEKPHLEARLAVDDLRVGRDSAGPIVLAVEADEKNCVASFDAGAPDDRDTGRATMRARAGCTWKNGTVPSIDPASPLELALDTTRFSLRPLGAFVDRWVQHLRGKIDTQLRAKVGSLAHGTTWSLGGVVHLREGNMLPLAIGREMKQIEIDAKFDPNVARIERVSAEIGAGRFTGTALLDLAGVVLERGHAELHVPRRQSIPLTAEGVSYGTIWGDVFAESESTADEIHIAVRAPTLRLELPPQRTSQLESLKDNPAVAVLQPLGPPEQPSIGGGPGAPLPTRAVLTFELGENVGISREDMKIELQSADPPARPTLTLPEERLEGAIRILGGRVPVAGRVFRIEHGVVSFSGTDLGDPALDIDAVYEGAEASGTRINVHVGGSAKNIKLALTSSPPKSESELLAILAFGEPTSGSAPATPTPQGGAGTTAGAATAAAGVGSAILTTGINQLLSQSVLPIRTSLATGASTTAAASLELTERVRFEYIRLLGTTLYGQPQDVNQFALDWRFQPRWLLRTVVGDRGTTTLDVLWNRWY
jgi:hypothetical protein